MSRTYEDEEETARWEAAKRKTASMEFPVDTSDLTLTGVRKVRPRHAKERNPIWSYIALGGYFAAAGFIGAFLGTLLANIL